MIDPFTLAMMGQGAANALGNLGNAERGQRTVPMNTAPMLMMMQKHKQRNAAIEQIKNDPSLTEQQKRALLVDPDVGAAAYVKSKFAKPPSWKDRYQTVGGTLLGPPATPGGDPRVVYQPKSGGGTFDIKSGDQIITYTGDEGDRSTWKEVARAPRYRPGTSGGSSQTERMMSRFVELEQKKALGQLTPREEANRRLLEFQLSSLRASGGGGIENVGPPQLFDRSMTTDPGSSVASGAGATSPATVTTIKEPKSDAVDFGGERMALGNVIDTLKEARTVGEVVTGWKGWMKAKFGGLARQFGAPVSDLAAKLDTRLEALAATMGPEMLNEKKITDQERARLSKLVGKVDSFTDEVDLLNKLRDVDSYLSQLEGRVKSESATPKTDEPRAGFPSDEEIKGVAERQGKTPEEVRRDLETMLMGGGGL